MVSNQRKILIIVTIMALLASQVSASNSRPPRNNDISNIADAIKYLQDLDTYYGDRARVRYGKRVSSPVQPLRNHLAYEAELSHLNELAAAEEPF